MPPRGLPLLEAAWAESFTPMQFSLGVRRVPGWFASSTNDFHDPDEPRDEMVGAFCCPEELVHRCSRKAKEPRERRRSPPAPLLLLLCTSAAGKEAASKRAGLVDAKAPALTQQLNEVAGGATTAAMRLLPLTDRDQAEALGSSRTAPATTLVLLAALLAAPPALSSGARVERLFYQSGGAGRTYYCLPRRQEQQQPAGRLENRFPCLPRLLALFCCFSTSGFLSILREGGVRTGSSSRKEGVRVRPKLCHSFSETRAHCIPAERRSAGTPPTRWPLRLINGFAIAERTLTPHTDHTSVCGDTRREWGKRPWDGGVRAALTQLAPPARGSGDGAAFRPAPERCCSPTTPAASLGRPPAAAVRPPQQKPRFPGGETAEAIRCRSGQPDCAGRSWKCEKGPRRCVRV
ncbi:hypothetical protein MRX96_041191 [Rhipicephalus microplus]